MRLINFFGGVAMNRKNSFVFLLLLAGLFMVSGCLCQANAPAGRNDFDHARELIRTNQAECVLMQNGKIRNVERGRGVSPLLRLYDRDPQAMQGAVIVDKVIGRAAAAIAICGKARHVHGQIMSDDAVAFLKANNITCSRELGVARILNRKRDGLCPLEQSVESINDPQEALKALRKKIAILAGGKR